MKLKHFAGGWLAICGLLTGCLSEPEFEPVVEDNGELLEVKLFNEIRQQAVTRVNDEGFCEGDEVGIYVVNYVNEAPGVLAKDNNQADNVKYTLEESSGAWTPETPVYYLDKKTKVDIYGYYPYSNPSEINAYPFEIAKDQSRDAENGKLGGYEASDFLWGKASEVSPTSSKVILQFHHIMAGVTVTLVEGSGFEAGEFVSLEKSAIITNTKRETNIDFATGTVTAIGAIPTTGTIPYKKGDEFRAIVAPQTVAGETPLFKLTVDGIPYVFSKTEDFTFIPGKLHKFSILINKKTLGGVEFQMLGESITAWESETFTHNGQAKEYVIVHCETAGSLKDAITAAGKDYTKLQNLKVTGNINANDFYFMRDQMTLLQAVNMRDVHIEAVGIHKDNEIPESAFKNKSSLIRFIFPDTATSINASAFNNSSLSGNLILPNRIQSIGRGAFVGCLFSGTLTLPDDLVIIGSMAFYNQKFIGELVIPEKVTSIGGSAFCGNRFSSLKLPESLEVIEVQAFYDSRNMTGDLTIPSKITEIAESAFSECKFDGTLTLPEGLLKIDNSAFLSCKFTSELKLPESLISIGSAAFCNCQFSGKLKLPESLVFIGTSAFKNNNRISGIIEIPESIISLPDDVFYGCRDIQGIIFNKNITNIGSRAFYNCYQLSSIICNAQNPPAVASDTFNGVAKDNFNIEVPESSVENYRTAPGWNEFKRISAHHDFAIGRSLFRTLNAKDSKKLTLRAPSGSMWRVESCPDWIRVNPESGTGKTEVTITVNEMAPNEAETVTYQKMNSSGYYENVSFKGRRDEVVFLLEGKDYRSRTIVEQYDYSPSGTVIGDGYVITNQTASAGNTGVNLVFMGDGFDAKDISEGKYITAANEAIEHFFGLPPYEQYRDYFNVYTIIGLSPDSGVGSVNTIREARFGSQYGLQNGGTISPDASTCFEFACKAPSVNEDNINKTLIILIENSTEYDGVCYMYGDGSAIALCPMSDDAYPYDFRGIVQHEAGGHGFGKLADEYIYHNAFIQTCTCNCCSHVDEFNEMKSRGWYENLSLSANIYDVPWSHFIFDSKYSNVVDIYEGGFFHSRGVFRSESNSCMNNNIPYYSAISREAIVKRIMEYAGEEYSFEAFKQKDVISAQSAAASADVKSGPSSLSYPTHLQHGPIYMGERPEFSR